jgi:uncharacterized membrane protein YozB (DUF420 family)
MSGILGTPASLFQDLTLLTQIVVFLLITWGYRTVKRKQRLTHGSIMGAAFVLHLISISLIMIPSVFLHFPILIGSATGGVLITWIHIGFGIASMIIGGYLVTMWRFQSPRLVECMRRRRFMLAAFLLWFISLLMGIGFYGYYFI